MAYASSQRHIIQTSAQSFLLIGKGLSTKDRCTELSFGIDFQFQHHKMEAEEIGNMISAANVQDAFGVFFPFALAVNIGRYLIIASLLHIILYKTPFFKNRSLPKSTKKTNIKREVFLSLQSCLIFSIFGLFVFFGDKLGYTTLYQEFGKYGLYYEIICLISILILFDFWFYSTHFLFHFFGARATTHIEHHNCTPTTVWGALAFSMPESAVFSIFSVVILLIFPISVPVYLAYMWIVVIHSAVGHSGCEVYPAWWEKNRMSSLFANVRHHYLHHKHGIGNLGLYSTVWDRLFRTEDPQYRSKNALINANEL